ncbi:MAG TPA: hypothetical protein VMK12_06955 [Anaeromyxobacteraceae bacterium]|nr:hypothetical protein [Anaeromyxobacteraceae bacterium]
MAEKARHPWKRIVIRLLAWEHSIIDQACGALDELERSTLIQEGIVAKANRLGICWSATRPAPLTAPWPYAVERGEQATAARVSISVSVPLMVLLKRAAQHVGTSEPLFAVGSTLAYVGRLQGLWRDAAMVKGTEETARRLRRIKLPPQYDYRRRRPK